MQFQVPQFIDIEDKIVGPLTLKQFLYLAGAGGVIFILFFILKFWLWLLISILFAAVGMASAFIRYNNQPLPKIAWFAFLYFWQPHLYLWQREAQERTIQVNIPEIPAVREKLFQMPNVRKLWHDLMTTKNPIPKREKPSAALWMKMPKERVQIWRKPTGEKDIAKRIDYSSD